MERERTEQGSDRAPRARISDPSYSYSDGRYGLYARSYYYQSYMRLDRHYKQHRVSIE